MQYTFQQGWLDSMCGIYSAVNAERLINKSTENESQVLFNEIVEYLSKKRFLKNAILNGINHKWLMGILVNVVGDKIPLRITNRKNMESVSCWWKYTQEFMCIPNRAVIISIGGIEDHFSVVKSMNNSIMNLSDSGGYRTITKSSCKLKGYDKRDKFIIFPAQCVYLGRE